MCDSLLTLHDSASGALGPCRSGAYWLLNEQQPAYARGRLAMDYFCWLDDPTQHVSVSGIFALYRQTLAKAAKLLDTLLAAPLQPGTQDSPDETLSPGIAREASPFRARRQSACRVAAHWHMCRKCKLYKIPVYARDDKDPQTAHQGQAPSGAMCNGA